MWLLRSGLIPLYIYTWGRIRWQKKIVFSAPGRPVVTSFLSDWYNTQSVDRHQLCLKATFQIMFQQWPFQGKYQVCREPFERIIIEGMSHLSRQCGNKIQFQKCQLFIKPLTIVNFDFVKGFVLLARAVLLAPIKFVSVVIRKI